MKTNCSFDNQDVRLKKTAELLLHIASSLVASPELTLECLCADDFGAGSIPPKQRKPEDVERLKLFKQTLRKHEMLEHKAKLLGIRALVQRSPDKYSDHSDAYLYFTLEQLPTVRRLLRTIRLPGDILDVPPSVSDEDFRKLEESTSWRVERT